MRAFKSKLPLCIVAINTTIIHDFGESDDWVAGAGGQAYKNNGQNAKGTKVMTHTSRIIIKKRGLEETVPRKTPGVREKR